MQDPDTVPTSAEQVGTRIGRAADLLGTRKSAATAIGVSAEQLTRYVRGQNQPPLDVMASLAAAAGVSLDWIATGEGSMMRGESPAAANVVPIGTPLDRDLMRAVVQELDRHLAEEEAAMDPDRKGEAVLLVYDYISMQKARDRAAVAQQVRRIMSVVG